MFFFVEIGEYFASGEESRFILSRYELLLTFTPRNYLYRYAAIRQAIIVYRSMFILFLSLSTSQNPAAAIYSLKSRVDFWRRTSRFRLSLTHISEWLRRKRALRSSAIRSGITEFISLNIFPTCVCVAITSESLNNENDIAIASRQT